MKKTVIILSSVVVAIVVVIGLYFFVNRESSFEQKVATVTKISLRNGSNGKTCEVDKQDYQAFVDYIKSVDKSSGEEIEPSSGWSYAIDFEGSEDFNVVPCSQDTVKYEGKLYHTGKSIEEVLKKYKGELASK